MTVEMDPAVEITLFPDQNGSRPIECFQQEGDEIYSEEFADAQIFSNVVTQLEKRRQKTKASTSKESTDGPNKRLKPNASDELSEDNPNPEEAKDELPEEDAIDPRMHYRPMVAELQAAVVELYQLVSTVDLIRPSKAPTKEPRYLEEVNCMRDDLHLRVKTDDLAYLLTSKSNQITEAADILLNGSKSLREVIVKERVFFKGVRNLLGRWKICAPMHGTIPKPFRAGEGLAIDCSYTSAGSKFTPQAMPIDAIAFAKLSRTEHGQVLIKKPEFFLRRTLKIALKNTKLGTEGHFILPPPKIQSRQQNFEQFTENDESRSLDESNELLLSDVQHAIFSEEAFQTILREALLPTSIWVDTCHSLENYFDMSTMKNRNIPMAILSIKDDQVELHIDQDHLLFISLVDADGIERIDLDEKNSISTTCMYAMSLLQQEIRNYHATCKTFNKKSMDSSRTILNEPTPKVLASLVNVLAHNVLKNQLTEFLDMMAMKLAYQNGMNSIVRVLDDCLPQPICDTVRGIFLFSRWKICHKASNASSLDFYVGKVFCKEIFIQGTKIQYEDISLNRRQVCGVDGFRGFICSIISKQIAISLYDDALAFGMTKASIDNDHSIVRIATPSDWDGTFVGEGKVPDEINVGCISLTPKVTSDGKAMIHCHLQALDTNPIHSYIIDGKEDIVSIDWASLPGFSDTSRLIWLLRTLNVLSESFK